MGLASSPSPALSQTINPAIVQKTLNPLPASVLIPSSAFTGSLVSLIPHPGNGADGITAELGFFPVVGTSGDLTNDGYPEVVLPMALFSFNPNVPGPPGPLYVFSTNATGTIQLDSQQLLGTGSVPEVGSTYILNLDRNGLNDFIYLGTCENPNNRGPASESSMGKEFCRGGLQWG